MKLQVCRRTASFPGLGCRCGRSFGLNLLSGGFQGNNQANIFSPNGLGIAVTLGEDKPKESIWSEFMDWEFYWDGFCWPTRPES